MLPSRLLLRIVKIAVTVRFIKGLYSVIHSPKSLPSTIDISMFQLMPLLAPRWALSEKAILRR